MVVDFGQCGLDLWLDSLDSGRAVSISSRLVSISGRGRRSRFQAGRGLDFRQVGLDFQLVGLVFRPVGKQQNRHKDGSLRDLEPMSKPILREAISEKSVLK